MTFRNIAILFVAILFSASTALAQQMDMQQQAQPIDLSDSDIEQFVDVYLQQQEIQQVYEPKMIEAIENEGLSLERFQQIIQAQQMGAESDATEAESEQFQSSMAQIQVIEMDMMSEVEEMLEEEGMDMERYEQIFVAINSDPEIQQKVQEKLMEKMGHGQGG